MIDWSFIGTLEGSRLTGYVPPADKHDRTPSGVTIARGIDLGQMSADQIKVLGIPEALRDKLEPYAEITGDAAQALLAAEPLRLTQEEADQLDAAVCTKMVVRLRDAYNACLLPIGLPGFDDIPPRAQTVIASVAFQYGNLAHKCPHFWRMAVTQDWDAVAHELEHFGDAFSTRRQKEAIYLKQLKETST